MELSQLEETKIVIKSLLKCHQHEVTVGKLSQDFYKSEGYQIPFAKLGYSSLETFLRSLGNLVEVCGKGYSATLKLIQNENLALNSVSLASNASNRELTADIFTEIQDEKPTVNLRRKSEDDVDLPPKCMKDFKVNSPVFNFPSQKIEFSTKLECYAIPDNVSINAIEAVVITEIHNPHKFWFHFCKENNKIDELMQNMQEFYNSLLPKRWLIPDTFLLAGQVCAASVNNIWYRAEVIDRINKNIIKVYCVDYGLILTVPAYCLKFLISIFAALPKQGIRGCLSQIQPKGQYWDIGAKEYFISKTISKLIFAQISKINKQDRVYHLALCDTSTNKPFQINKALVTKGFAEFELNTEFLTT
ncbi:tudor and KH domain-containing protein [Teleopsis dalmanni]|uniref:tudor and KH domain-containing protein n=1 Tax=Teleopsis dalmanni TaxID=139649 RepID=UPI0018CDAEC0|nr:tudor and KH domain-containing protein [Teleopsis dalmanni]XP_037950905.1 tudor and KH domain-containing protein [Teleopsis dalmanni]XP_037950907.1 tudor and KH domain-containing protein [Teleopsis dalmanni]